MGDKNPVLLARLFMARSRITNVNLALKTVRAQLSLASMGAEVFVAGERCLTPDQQGVLKAIVTGLRALKKAERAKATGGQS